jgi:hypothetical protein
MVKQVSRYLTGEPELAEHRSFGPFTRKQDQ